MHGNKQEILKSSPDKQLDRREALARLGMGAAVIYTAPVLLSLSEAKASSGGASGGGAGGAPGPSVRVFEDDVGVFADQFADRLAESAPFAFVLGVFVRPELVPLGAPIDDRLAAHIVEQRRSFG